MTSTSIKTQNHKQLQKFYFLIYYQYYLQKNLQQIIMQQLKEEEEEYQIQIKRPFHGKFIKELNYHTNEKCRKEKKKLKVRSIVTNKKIQKHDQYGLNFEFKYNKKMVEVHKNGNKIIAMFKNNQLHGEAEIHYYNGIVFRGLYQNGIKVKGHFLFVNGYEYIGNCFGNKFCGQGALIFPSGKIISGEWKQYILEGNAKIQYPQGQVYYGQVQNFKKHGKGHLFFNDNSKYVGQFKFGLITGNGSYYMNDELITEGQWQNGELIKGNNAQTSLSLGRKDLSIDDIIIEESLENDNDNDGDDASDFITEQVELKPRIKESRNIKKVRFA